MLVCVQSIRALEPVFVSAFRLCVSKRVFVIYHRSFVFPPLAVFVFTCSSYLIRPHRRSKSLQGEVFCLVHLNHPESAPLWHHLLTVTLDKAGKQKFVKHVSIKYTDMAETSPVLSDYSGKGSGLVTPAGVDGCGFIHL